MSSNNEPILDILYKKLQQQPLTPEEEALLNNWLGEPGEADNIFNQLKDDRELVEYLTLRLDRENEQRALQQFRSKAFSPPSGKTQSMRSRYLGWAAAIFLLIAAAVVLWLINNSRHQNAAPPLVHNTPLKDALPGSDRAVLTLASGEKILLDSNKKDILQQSGFRISNGDGQLDYNGRSAMVEEHTLTTPRGGQYKVLLPDGTQVWLNAASSITYPTAFTGNSRSVRITGELYFEVAKDKTKPFHVILNDMEVEVLGTHFNINGYNDEEAIKTTLLEGSVKVSSMANGELSILRPGEQVTLSQSSHLSKPIPVLTDEVMAWKNGLFSFNRASLSAVLRQLSRWYDVEVVYEKGVPDINFSGEIKRDLNLSQVLEGLEKMGVRFSIEGKKLIVVP